MKAALLNALQAARAAKTPVALVTALTDGTQALVFHDRVEEIGRASCRERV